MSRRYGRNQRRRQREALDKLSGQFAAQVEITRLVAYQLAECRFALERARQALMRGRDTYPARAIGAPGPFRDNVPLDQAIPTILDSTR